MKRILIVCLLGMGLLLPTSNLTAKEFFMKRIIDVWIEGRILIATSDSNTGSLTHIKIVDGYRHTVLETDISGYYDSVDLSSLSSGNYNAVVTTTLSSYTEMITLN